MTSSSWGHGSRSRRLAILGTALGAAAVLVSTLFVLRGMTFRTLAAVGAEAPPAVRSLVDLVAQAGLLVLVALCLVAAARARLRGTRPLAVAGCAAIAVLLAHLVSELVKLAVSERRPCRNFSVETLAVCPPHGDWAWPSNHATLAGAMATAVVVLVPRLWWLAASVALAVAAARVLVGVHHPHDVVAGLVLGGAVVLATVHLGADRGHRLLLAAAGRSRVVATLVGRHRTAPRDPARPLAPAVRRRLVSTAGRSRVTGFLPLY